MQIGEHVVAVRDIGGLFSESVPKGTRGVVTETSWTGDPKKVMFQLSGMFSDRKVEASVSKDDVV